jgi:hypothetical protein
MLVAAIYPGENGGLLNRRSHIIEMISDAVSKIRPIIFRSAIINNFATTPRSNVLRKFIHASISSAE